MIAIILYLIIHDSYIYVYYLRSYIVFFKSRDQRV